MSVRIFETAPTRNSNLPVPHPDPVPHLVYGEPVPAIEKVLVADKDVLRDPVVISEEELLEALDDLLHVNEITKTEEEK